MVLAESRSMQPTSEITPLMPREKSRPKLELLGTETFGKEARLEVLVKEADMLNQEIEIVSDVYADMKEELSQAGADPESEAVGSSREALITLDEVKSMKERLEGQFESALANIERVEKGVEPEAKDTRVTEGSDYSVELAEIPEERQEEHKQLLLSADSLRSEIEILDDARDLLIKDKQNLEAEIQENYRVVREKINERKRLGDDIEFRVRKENIKVVYKLRDETTQLLSAIEANQKQIPIIERELEETIDDKVPLLAKLKAVNERLVDSRKDLEKKGLSEGAIDALELGPMLKVRLRRDELKKADETTGRERAAFEEDVREAFEGIENEAKEMIESGEYYSSKTIIDQLNKMREAAKEGDMPEDITNERIEQIKEVLIKNYPPVEKAKSFLHESNIISSLDKQLMEVTLEQRPDISDFLAFARQADKELEKYDDGDIKEAWKLVMLQDLSKRIGLALSSEKAVGRAHLLYKKEREGVLEEKRTEILRFEEENPDLDEDEMAEGVNRIHKSYQARQGQLKREMNLLNRNEDNKQDLLDPDGKYYKKILGLLEPPHEYIPGEDDFGTWGDILRNRTRARLKYQEGARDNLPNRLDAYRSVLEGKRADVRARLAHGEWADNPYGEN